MDQEIEHIVQAISIAADPVPQSLAVQQEALNYLNAIQQSKNAWQLGLHIFAERSPDESSKYPSQTRFFALTILDNFLDNRLESFDDPTFQTLHQTFMNYLRAEFVFGSSESSAPFLRNKFSHTLSLFFLCTYIDQWPTFFEEVFSLLRPQGVVAESTYNRHVSLLFFRIVLEISGEVADQLLKSARIYTPERNIRDGRVRDTVRERDAARINTAVLTIVAEGIERMNELRKRDAPYGEIEQVVEIVDTGMRTFGSYVGWIDISLTVTPTTVPLMFTLLADESLSIRLATAVVLLRIVSKGLKEPEDKFALFKILSLHTVLDALEAKTRQEQIQRGEDADEGEESYREALGKLLNAFGVELSKLVETKVEATAYLEQTLAVMLRFLADDYDDTCNTVFPLLQMTLSSYKRVKRLSTEPLDNSKHNFLSSLLQVLLVKMKWDIEADPSNADEDDNMEFDNLRKDLRTFTDSVMVIDPTLVTDAICNLVLSTLAAYQQGITLKWNDAELAVYLVYIFGEINKIGGKGRPAFCRVAIDKENRKDADYSEFPLTPHGEMLYGLCQCGIVGHPHASVALQFFEAAARYPDFFKVRKECILPTLEAMLDTRGLHRPDAAFRDRMNFLFSRFIRETKNDISPEIAVRIIGGVSDLTTVEVTLSEASDDSGESDSLVDSAHDAALDSQLYLFETIGTLCALLYKMPDEQAGLLLSVMKPLIDDLSTHLQRYIAKGLQDVYAIVKVHHLMMALGNVIKGFPDYPNPVPENYNPPPLSVFAQVAQAILVSLERMNTIRIIRDAARFAFTRIFASAGPNVTQFIPPLMGNLLTQFEPSELSDFMNFVSQLLHRLQGDMFDVLDELIGPLSTHIAGILSKAASGTDEERAHIETRRAYLSLLNVAMGTKLHRVFTSPRNNAKFEALIDSVLRIAVDPSEPVAEKAAVVFLTRAIVVWAAIPIANDAQSTGDSLPGFERVVYERVIPSVFRVLSHPQCNPKDGQMLVVLHEIANLLTTVCKTRGPEAYEFFVTVYFPSQNWPQQTALEFTTKMRDLEPKQFRKYFTDFVRSSREA
ncbi:ARM repeat-containing protein [Fistulina hepatica ATCC 64428]|nr:ARM repeat-containing protein [Fistulina hepatica ATCC 64428]